MATKLTTLSLPTALKLSTLKSIAQRCGLQTTGTKPIILSRLQHEISTPSLLSQHNSTRILSIDMGIRNLAYCMLDVPPIKKLQNVDGSKERGKPVLMAWHRLAVSSKPEIVDDEVPVKEAFDPATLSNIAYELLKKRLLVSKPDVILIERQRFRSMGSKHILEWTIRVNMFESILYATLHTLRAEGLWNGNVIPITPGKVGPFWVGEESDFLEEAEKEKAETTTKKIRTSKSAKIMNKGAKVDLVREWCDSEEAVSWGSEQGEEMARRYIQKWDAKPGRAKSNGTLAKEKPQRSSGEKMGKLDDLADCLLQGMAWVEWEKNKRLVLEKGYQTLLAAEAV